MLCIFIGIAGVNIVVSLLKVIIDGDEKRVFSVEVTGLDSCLGIVEDFEMNETRVVEEIQGQL